MKYYSTLRGRCVTLTLAPMPLCKGSSHFLSQNKVQKLRSFLDQSFLQIYDFGHKTSTDNYPFQMMLLKHDLVCCSTRFRTAVKRGLRSTFLCFQFAVEH